MSLKFHPKLPPRSVNDTQHRLWVYRVLKEGFKAYRVYSAR